MKSRREATTYIASKNLYQSLIVSCKTEILCKNPYQNIIQIEVVESAVCQKSNTLNEINCDIKSFFRLS